MITEGTVSRVREASDIVDVIGEHVPLKRAGKDFKGLCPFHQEKTPSFMVSPSKGIFHCFGCGVGGDVFKFVMETERMTYPEAVERLAEKKGIVVERDNAPAPNNQAYERKKLLNQVLERAAQFYHKSLLDGRDASIARRYVTERRGLRPETIEKFRVGWAPAGPDSLVKTALKAGFAEADLLEAGVAVKSQRDGRVLDSFRGRVIFPIQDMKGQVIGFGGRVLEEEVRPGMTPSPRQQAGPPKYLNSSDSAIFQKGKNLYGFYQGSKAVRQSEEALILEGYMDVIAANQAGVENAVAPLGTSLTTEQCQILRRYASNVTVLFDMDKAGETAGIRGAELLLEHGFFPMMARLPGAKDVDEYLKKHSPEDLKAVLAKKITLVDFRVDVLLKEKENLPPQVRRASAAKAALPLALKAQDEIIRGEILKGIAFKTGVSLESLNAEWRKLAGGKGAWKAGETAPASTPSGTLRARDILNPEEELLCLALEHAQLRPRLLSLEKEHGLFHSSPLKEGFETLRRNEVQAATGLLREVFFRFSRTRIDDPEAIFESIAERLHQKKEEERLKELGREASKISNEGIKDSPALEEFRKLATVVKGRKE